MSRILLFLMSLALLWALGLFMFVADLPRESLRELPKADGIVVYTGGGARIAAGMELMERGAAERLLISGVNPGTSRAALIEMMPSARPLFECCVDLGREAQTTEGNAAEVRDWALKNGFETLILVTSEYHMPRALVETRARLPKA
ncbi:MAG: YdcF family protein, partial [Parvularculaceae bacterium]|nr:YdcF family protein [Parvularculaceae bacterium]